MTKSGMRYGAPGVGGDAFSPDPLSICGALYPLSPLDSAPRPGQRARPVCGSEGPAGGECSTDTSYKRGCAHRAMGMG